MNADALHDAKPPALVEGELRFACGLNERLFELLAAIDAAGSINRAARVTGLSYKGAWEMLERANNLAPKTLIETATGGRHGGGARLTPAGRELLALYSKLQEDHRQFLRQLNRRLADNPDILFLLKRLIMKASARNQFFGKVSAVHLGAVTAEVEVEIKGGAKIVATITVASAENLGIEEGVEVVALVKAPLVIVMTDAGGYRLSARNQLPGIVSVVHKGAVNSEVIVELSGGDSIAATVTNESLETLGLKAGVPATAVFKAGSVILGVAEG
jgi:molybdate transport system regulatory protein